MTSFFRKPDHNAFITPLIVSALFGMAAGAVGTLIVIAATPVPEPVVQRTVVQPVGRITIDDLRIDAAVAEAAVSSSALIVRARPASAQTGSAAVLDRVVVPAEALGAAMVLTSDGWLLTTETTMPPAARTALAGYRVVIGAETYAIRSATADPFTGVVFLKIDAANLPVTAFAAGTGLALGEPVIVFDATGGPRRADVVGYGARPSSAAEVVRSSERMQNVLRLSGVEDAVPPGSIVVSASGEVVALFAGSDAYGAVAIPFGAFRGQVSAMLRDGKANRPVLGVRYADLAHAPGIGEGFGVRPRGALLVASTGAPAVTRGGPAERAGLVAGDLILAVNGEELGARTALADVIAEYAPGSVVTLTVRRANGMDASIPVTLSAAP